ncbi:MAG: hypothetical protein M1490_00495 [Candidatus Bathyarchaeota archaeon]|nr:hypothetical protein [Candidatus Bathyarchaeota archaeon]
MSKELKDDYLLAKIKETKRKINILRNGVFLAFIVLVVSGISWLYLVTHFLVGMVIVSNILLFIVVLGACLSLVTIILSIRYNGRNKGYYKELTIIPKELASSTICPNCRKNLPEEYVDVCVFCGYDLGIE